MPLAVTDTASPYMIFESLNTYNLTDAGNLRLEDSDSITN